MRRAILAAAMLSGATRPALAGDSLADLTNDMQERRMGEAAIWGMPAVNYDLMLQEMLTRTNGKVNQVIYWGKPLDWHNQTLTPNPDTLYFMAFLDSRDVGPIVIEIPPAGQDGSLSVNIAEELVQYMVGAREDATA
jgi:hypothetical protein